MRESRALLVWMTVLGSFAPSRLARAQPSVQMCSDAYTKGQEERLAGRLYSAQRQFLTCSDPACPAAIVHDCAQWKREVEAELPTIRVTVVDSAGKSIEPPAYALSIDGVPVAIEALAKPILVDPGRHRVSVEAYGFQAADVDTELKPEDRNLPIAVVLQPAAAAPVGEKPEPAAPRRDARPFPTAPVVLAGVGAVALGGSIYFGLSAKSQYDDYKQSCAPNCAASKGDSVHSKALISDIGLGAAALAFGAAAWLYFSSSADTEPRAALAVTPLPAGGQARLRLAF